MYIAKKEYKIDQKFLVFQITAFELVVVNSPITTRILVVGSQLVNKQSQNLRSD